MANKTLLRCKKAFALGTRVVRRGETFLSDHDIVKGREQFFENALPEGCEVVERATAAPGEKRETRKREKAPTKAKPDATK